MEDNIITDYIHDLIQRHLDDTHQQPRYILMGLGITSKIYPMVEKLDWFQMDQTVGSFSFRGIHVIRSVDLEDDAIIIV